MKVLIVDDHALIRSGLADALARHFSDIEVLAEDSGNHAMTLLDSQAVDLAIVDLFLPGEENFSFLRNLCLCHPKVIVVVLTASENPSHVRKCFDLGVSGYIPKSLPQAKFLEALETVLAGGIFLPANLDKVVNNHSDGNELPEHISIEMISSLLTPRQQQILSLVSQGMSNKQIARECSLSENTIKVHVSSILRALGLSNRTQAGIVMEKLGLNAD